MDLCAYSRSLMRSFHFDCARFCSFRGVKSGTPEGLHLRQADQEFRPHSRPRRHGDGNGLYLVVDQSGGRRWILRVTVKGQRNRKVRPNRTDFGLGGADIITVARERALEYRRLAKQGLNPKCHHDKQVPCFEEVARQVHIERLPTWKNPMHGRARMFRTTADE